MARSLNGSSDQINCGTAWSHYSTATTFSAWIYPTSFANTYNCVAQVNDSIDAFQFFTKSTGKMAWYLGSGANIDPGTATLSTGTWYHILQKFDNADQISKTFINGASDGTIFSGANIHVQTGTPTLAVGYDALTINRNFPGRIADFAFWNVALTPGEVSALAQGARPLTIRPSNIIAYLPLDGISSPEPDLSGAKNNGTLTGTSNVGGPPLAMFTPRWPRNFEAAAAGFNPAWRVPYNQIPSGGYAT